MNKAVAGASPAASVASAGSAAPGATGHAGARRRLAGFIALALATGGVAGLATGAAGFSLAGLWADLNGGDAGLLLGQIRAPRTLGALLVGALLGLAGALAQGVFRNPLADPYLLGSASGAALGVVLVLAAGTAFGTTSGAAIGFAPAAWVARIGLVAAAFLGALGGVSLTLALASGAVHTLRLLLAGVVIGVLLGAVSDLITTVAPATLSGKQAFMLGSTSFLGWPALALLGAGLAALITLARRHARALDALTLGEDSAASLGLDLARVRLALVALLCLATALAVSQAGLVAFVGLVAPHLVRRNAPGLHGWLMTASAGLGAALLLWADVLSRALVAPEELPVGVVTAVLGGSYLVWLLRRGAAP
jgi:iron complex transport system permease protein